MRFTNSSRKLVPLVDSTGLDDAGICIINRWPTDRPRNEEAQLGESCPGLPQSRRQHARIPRYPPVCQRVIAREYWNHSTLYSTSVTGPGHGGLLASPKVF